MAAFALMAGWQRDLGGARLQPDRGDIDRGRQTFVRVGCYQCHGYEGQGPEHSSARIERFIQLAAKDNIQIAQPSDAAQYFHLLRRQALRHWRKPLVVFTPKSMLRHPDASSPIEDFTHKNFQNVIPDTEIGEAERILICTGKIGHELRSLGQQPAGARHRPGRPAAVGPELAGEGRGGLRLQPVRGGLGGAGAMDGCAGAEIDGVRHSPHAGELGSRRAYWRASCADSC